MKKSVVIFLLLAFVQFISVFAFSTDSIQLNYESSTVQKFSLKTDYTSRINMKNALFSVRESDVKEAVLIQESAEAMSLEEEIKSLKKKRSGYLFGSIGLFAAAGLCFWRFTEVEPKKAERPGLEGSGGEAGTPGMGKMMWMGLGAVSAAMGVLLVSSYSKTSKAVKAKQKELENLYQAQQKLAQALNN
jgi:hypothetical protein